MEDIEYLQNRIGYDHPAILPVPYCILCARSGDCLDTADPCYNPGLTAVLLHRVCRGVLAKTFRPGMFKCKKCGAVVWQVRHADA